MRRPGAMPAEVAEAVGERAAAWRVLLERLRPEPVGVVLRQQDARDAGLAVPRVPARGVPHVQVDVGGGVPSDAGALARGGARRLWRRRWRGRCAGSGLRERERAAEDGPLPEVEPRNAQSRTQLDGRGEAPPWVAAAGGVEL